MQLHQLEYLLKVVECGSISQAAQKLYLSQPSLTKSIINLEQEYGIQIFERLPRGIRLTPEGKDFVHYAKRIITASNMLDKTFSKKSQPKQYLFSIASLQMEFLYDILIRIYWQYAEHAMHFNILETDRGGVTRAVLNGSANLGILVRSSVDSKGFIRDTESKYLETYVIDSAPTNVCVGPKSPYYDREAISVQEAENSSMIIIDMESEAKRDLYFNVQESHFNEEKTIFVNTASVCREFLRKTDVLLYASKWICGFFRDTDIHVLPIIQDGQKTFPTNELVLLKRKGTPLSAPEKQFIHHLYGLFNKQEPSSI